MSEKRIDKEFTITVVDDNPAVQQFVAKVLRMQGYRVLEAGCGAEALDMAEGHDKQVNLLLTDIDMPGMDGVSLSREVRERWPETKVVFMCGGATPDGVGGEPFLSKPFALRELVTLVDDSLNSSCQPSAVEMNGIPATRLNPIALAATNTSGG
jgi:two-component system, cell cycle sensor histidine kinase and response regulator CckA